MELYDFHVIYIYHIWDVIPSPLTLTPSFFKMVKLHHQPDGNLWDFYWIIGFMIFQLWRPMGIGTSNNVTGF